MVKVVINADFGGFGLSNEAIREYGRRKGLNLVAKVDKRNNFVFFYENEIKENNFFYDRDIPRDDLDLVAIVEEMGKASWNQYSCLKVVEIPDDVDWYIQEYDGDEWIAERHRIWR
jgi:hypothetical protein